MIVRVEGLDYDSETGAFHCSEHPEHQLSSITWEGVGFICEAPLPSTGNDGVVQCLKYAQFSTVEVLDEEVRRMLRLAQQETVRITGSQMHWPRLPLAVKHLFMK